MIKLFDVKTDNVTDYKKTSLLLVFPKCSGKCGHKCQNYSLINRTDLIKEYNIEDIVKFYNNLKTHDAVVFAGLEPLDTLQDCCNMIFSLSQNCVTKPVTIVVYTGYDKKDYKEKYEQILLSYFEPKNIKTKLIVKYGSYDPENYSKSFYSEILGVQLATSNQGVLCYTKNFVEEEIYNQKSKSKTTKIIRLKEKSND